MKNAKHGSRETRAVLGLGLWRRWEGRERRILGRFSQVMVGLRYLDKEFGFEFCGYAGALPMFEFVSECECVTMFMCEMVSV